jgi:hypothetical protein
MTKILYLLLSMTDNIIINLKYKNYNKTIIIIEFKLKIQINV